MVVTGNKIIGPIGQKKSGGFRFLAANTRSQSWAERDEAPSMAARFACESLNLDPARLLFLPSSSDKELSLRSSSPAFGLHHP